MGWSANRSVAAVLARAAKKILPKRSAGVEIFLSRWTFISLPQNINKKRQVNDLPLFYCLKFAITSLPQNYLTLILNDIQMFCTNMVQIIYKQP